METITNSGLLDFLFDVYVAHNEPGLTRQEIKFIRLNGTLDQPRRIEVFDSLNADAKPRTVLCPTL